MKYFSIIKAALLITIGLGLPLTSVAAGHSGSEADPARGKEIANTVCVACHAMDGNSISPEYPKLAGQHPGYLLKQMLDFKATASKSAARKDATMNSMIAAFDETQMRDMAAYYSLLKQSPGTAKNRDTVLAGQKLYRAGDASKGIPACAACHSPTGTGIPDQYPRISGQYATYTEAQLKAFRDGTRTNDQRKMMQMIALKMTDAEIKAVSDYIAGLSW